MVAATSAERSARYREKDVDAYREQKAALARTEKHRETRRLYMQRWREENREKHNQQARESHARNRHKHVDKRRERHFKAKYGLTMDQRSAMIEAQEGKCLICESPFRSRRSAHVDHCHTTGRVRGILCHVCNTKLGWFEANRGRIMDYLA